MIPEQFNNPDKKKSSFKLLSLPPNLHPVPISSIVPSLEGKHIFQRPTAPHPPLFVALIYWVKCLFFSRLVFPRSRSVGKLGVENVGKFSGVKGSTFFFAQLEMDLFWGSEIVFENMKQIAHFCHVIRSVLINFISSPFVAGMNSRELARFKVQQVFKNTLPQNGCNREIPKINHNPLWWRAQKK